MENKLPAILESFFVTVLDKELYLADFTVDDNVKCRLVEHTINNIDPEYNEAMVNISLKFEYINVINNSKCDTSISLACLCHLNGNDFAVKDETIDRTFTIMLMAPVVRVPSHRIQELQVICNKLNRIKYEDLENISNNNIFRNDTEYHVTGDALYYQSLIPVPLNLHNDFIHAILKEYSPNSDRLSDNLVALLVGNCIYKYLLGNYLCLKHVN